MTVYHTGCLLQCDLRNDKEVEDMFQWIKDEPGLGRIDVCVANAGISPDKSLLEGEETELRFHRFTTIFSQYM